MSKWNISPPADPLYLRGEPGTGSRQLHGLICKWVSKKAGLRQILNVCVCVCLISSQHSCLGFPVQELICSMLRQTSQLTHEPALVSRSAASLHAGGLWMELICASTCEIGPRGGRAEGHVTLAADVQLLACKK